MAANVPELARRFTGKNACATKADLEDDRHPARIGRFREREQVPTTLTPARGFDISRVHRECLVNKKELVGKIALDARLTRSQAALALDALLEGIQNSLVRGDRVTISGFGTFGVKHRKARKVRNPKSGHAVEIAAKRVPRFAAGVDLRSALKRESSGPGLR